MLGVARNSTSSPVVVGEMAPDATVWNGDGGAVRVADLWRGAPRALVLVFFRHFG
ncbi:MAG: hypothetical protein AVDCRST_MAG73-2234 [uncultured Thermomicrobiales bacterium]|uniref:Alkyl hydroperoxide reductase subunit C/ Thiol specific antioxidant domain-containing protein n=1 Tax=uncultured Thermomicrobiales bacterium TaxID=1645740 RepID=A0A6J4U9N1_9BACT|nr:MAG: hypothetical protein AVDCRST_MAG73-2234 [uncultured Thermomicrobiales bacterium]